MSLLEITLEGVVNKVDVAIKRLKAFEPPEGYWLAFSGGKDSVTIKRLADMAGVKYEAHYNCTSVDPPELVRFVREQKDVSFDVAHDSDGNPITIWNLIVKKRMPPTRIARYCCAELKEPFGTGRIVVTGVRWAESARRRASHDIVTIYNSKHRLTLNSDNDDARRMVESCYAKKQDNAQPNSGLVG